MHNKISKQRNKPQNVEPYIEGDYKENRRKVCVTTKINIEMNVIPH
jgi:hypothetical protein